MYDPIDPDLLKVKANTIIEFLKGLQIYFVFLTHKHTYV